MKHSQLEGYALISTQRYLFDRNGHGSLEVLEASPVVWIVLRETFYGGGVNPVFLPVDYKRRRQRYLVGFDFWIESVLEKRTNVVAYNEEYLKRYCLLTKSVEKVRRNDSRSLKDMVSSRTDALAVKLNSDISHGTQVEGHPISHPGKTLDG